MGSQCSGPNRDYLRHLAFSDRLSTVKPKMPQDKGCFSELQAPSWTLESIGFYQSAFYRVYFRIRLYRNQILNDALGSTRILASFCAKEVIMKWAGKKSGGLLRQE